MKIHLKINDLVIGTDHPNKIIYKVINLFEENGENRCSLEIIEVPIELKYAVQLGEVCKREYCLDYEVYKRPLKGHPYTTIFKEFEKEN